MKHKFTNLQLGLAYAFILLSIRYLDLHANFEVDLIIKFIIRVIAIVVLIYLSIKSVFENNKPCNYKIGLYKTLKFSYLGVFVYTFAILAIESLKRSQSLRYYHEDALSNILHSLPFSILEGGIELIILTILSFIIPVFFINLKKKNDHSNTL